MGFDSPIHWIIVIGVIALLFGGSRVGSLMGELGKGVKAFKQNITDDRPTSPPTGPSPTTPSSTAPTPPATVVTPTPTVPTALEHAEIIEPTVTPIPVDHAVKPTLDQTHP